MKSDKKRLDLLRKLMSLCIALSLAFGGISLGNASFGAALFSDVDANHWALSAIKNMSDKKIMPGYSDASYKPAQKVSKVELVTVAYRLLKETGKLGTFNASDSVARNKATLASAKIPALLAPYSSDVYTAFSFALDKGFITKEELSTYVSNGNLVDATKEQISALLGKALSSAQNQSVGNKIIAFSFKDAADINSLYAPYISLLVDNKIISKTGDSSGNFGPRTNMGRDIFANMVNSVYGLITGTTTPSGTATTGTGTTTGSTTGSSTSTTPTTPTNTSTNSNSGLQNATISGTITSILTDKLSIEVKDSLGKTAVYNLTGTEMVKNSAAIGFLNLVVGDNVILSVVSGKVSKMVVEKNYSKSEGSLVEVSKPVTDLTTGKPFRVVTLKKADGKLEYYKIESGLYVEVDRVIKTIDDISKGDKLIVSYDGYFARKVESFTAKSEVLITLIKVTDFRIGSTLTYKLQDGRVFDNLFKADAEVVKINNKDLLKGDIVKATFVYGDLKRLEATGLVSEDQGVIKELLISDTTSKVTILNTQNERKTYNVQSKIVVNIGDTTANADGLYQLRLGQFVSLNMDALGIYNLKVTTPTVDKTKLTLTLMEVVKGTNLLKATDSDGKVWVVNLKSGIDAATNFVPGDKIEVTGSKLSDLIFEAETLTKVN